MVGRRAPKTGFNTPAPGVDEGRKPRASERGGARAARARSPPAGPSRARDDVRKDGGPAAHGAAGLHSFRAARVAPRIPTTPQTGAGDQKYGMIRKPCSGVTSIHVCVRTSKTPAAT